MREADDGADADAGAFEDVNSEGDGVGFDADGGDIVGFGELAAFLQISVGEDGLEEGVVEHLGDVVIGVVGHTNLVIRCQNDGDILWDVSSYLTHPLLH